MMKFSAGKTLAVAAVAGGALAASIAPVMAEVSAQSPSTNLVRVESPAKLKAWGAAVDVQVTYVCPQFSGPAYVSVSLSQNVLGRIASGYASKQVTCTGGFETTTLSLQAQNLAFWPLKAHAKAELGSYPNPASDAREIDLKY